MKPATQFICEPLEDLTRQLLFAPPAKRIDQICSAESLHDDIDGTVNYPLDFITYRITGYPPEAKEATLLVGAAVLPDLRWMIDALSRTVHTPEDPEDPIETIRDLAARLRVSTKTIERYRRLGLRWRWARPVQGRRRVICFTRSGVDCFLQRHGRRVERAGNFTQMEPADRERLVVEARREARASKVSLHQVASRLAATSGRAVETVRLMLEHHDRDHPDEAIFPSRPGPLTTRQKDVIARALAMGISVQKLIDRFGRTRSTIYRAGRERRAARLRRMRPRAVVHADFDRHDAEQRYPPVAPATLTGATGPATTLADGAASLPGGLRQIYHRAEPEAKTVRAALIRFNYAKYRARQLCESLDRYEPRVKDLGYIEVFLAEAAVLRRALIASHLPVIHAVATRHLIEKSDAAATHLAELLAAGNDVLVDAVDQFDWTQRQTFEAYLRWRLMRRFAAQSADPTRAQRRLDDDAVTRLVQDSLARHGIAMKPEER